MPYWSLDLSEETYKFTCLRDPVERILSHYKMLKDYQEDQLQHPCMLREESWLGVDVVDFINNVPKEHLLNQLYMFSKEYNIDEAIERLNEMNCVLFSDQLQVDLHRIANDLSLTLNYQHRHVSRERKFEAGLYDYLNELLGPEYELIRQLKANR